MAIKFVDQDPGKDDKPRKVAPPKPAEPAPSTEAGQADAEAGGQLLLAKSEPKPRGRKKPLR